MKIRKYNTRLDQIVITRGRFSKLVAPAAQPFRYIPISFNNL